MLQLYSTPPSGAPSWPRCSSSSSRYTVSGSPRWPTRRRTCRWWGTSSARCWRRRWGGRSRQSSFGPWEPPTTSWCSRRCTNGCLRRRRCRGSYTRCIPCSLPLLPRLAQCGRPSPANSTASLAPATSSRSSSTCPSSSASTSWAVSGGHCFWLPNYKQSSYRLLTMIIYFFIHYILRVIFYFYCSMIFRSYFIITSQKYSSYFQRF